MQKADSVAADGTPHYITATTHLTSAGKPAYDIYGRPLSETDPLGRATTTTYMPATGAAPTSIKITQPRVTGQLQGFSTTTSLDPARGLQLSSSDAAGYVTSSTYDPLGRVTATWKPGFSKLLGAAPNVKYTYNLSDSVPSTVTTQTLVDNGTATTYQTSVSIYDAMLRPRESQTATVDGGRIITDTAYDEHGWAVLGRRITQTDADTRTSTSSYDNTGNLLTTTDARGRTITYTYDEIGRKTAEYDTTGGASPSSSNELSSWTYDTLKKGLPTSSTAYANGSAYTEKLLGYDSHGWPQSTETIIPAGEGALQGTYITDRSYTPTGNLHSYTDSAAGSLPQETISYGYDTFGRPTSAGGDVASWDYVDKLTWTEYDEPQQFTFGPSGNFAQTTYSYDEQTRRLSDALTVTGSGHVKADSESYTYQPAGDVTRISDELDNGGTDTQCFRYDYAQRLSAAWTATDDCAATPSAGSASTVGGPAPYWQSWTYDTTGDRRTETDHDLAGDSTKDTVATYTDAKATGGPAHALAQVDTHAPTAAVPDTATAYTYDDAGNVATRTTGAGTDTFTFDTEGNLAQLDRTGQATPTTYVYDADGNLLLRHDAGGSTLFLGDEEVTLKSGDTTASGVRYISIAGLTVAVHSSDGTFSYLVSDRQGTAQLEIDSGSQALTRRQYLPFGGTRTSTSGWVGERGYVGGQQDDSTGLTNLGAREYDASTGRFLSPDPLLVPGAPQTWNAYAYAANDPVTTSDPSGACDADLCGYGTPKGDGSGNIITTAPVDPGNPSAGTCRNGKCTGTKPTPSAATKKARDEALAAALNAATRNAQASAAKAAKEGLTNQLIDVVSNLIGYDDAKSCFTEGDVMGCIKTALYDLPWTKVLDAEKVATTLGKAARVWRDIEKAETAVKDAEEAAKAADDAAKVAEHKAEGAEAADEAAAGCRTGVHSFLGDTPVRLASGGTEPISELHAGDTVLATDPQTGLTRAEKVERLIVTQTDRDFTDLTLASPHQPGAKPQKLTTTWHHPFWDATHHRWTDAHNLTPGTRLLGPDGTPVTVTAVRNYHRQAVTYDLTVADLHTYYVEAGTTPVLVHNDDGEPVTDDFNQARNRALDWLSSRGFKAEKVTLGKFGTIKGKPIGMQTADGKAGFRIEFDGRSGAHINVWAGKEKGPHFQFNASEATVTKLQRLHGCG